MLSILDKYILKRYLGTFSLLLLLFIPIGITVHLAEKIDKILENEVPFVEVVLYFLDFTIYFANLLFPLFLFLSVIWFTSTSSSCSLSLLSLPSCSVRSSLTAQGPQTSSDPEIGSPLTHLISCLVQSSEISFFFSRPPSFASSFSSSSPFLSFGMR